MRTMRLGRALLVAIAMAFAGAAPLTATAIVGFRTPTRVILGTDSRQIDNVGEQTSVCKLRSAGRWWLSVGGFKSTINYDLVEDVVNELSGTSTLDQVRAALEARVMPRLHAAVVGARHLPGTESLNLYQQGNVVAAMFVGGTDVSDVTPRLAAWVVMMENAALLAMRTYWLTCPGPSCDDAEGTMIMGSSVASDGPVVRLTKRPRPAWVSKADAAAAHRLISEQIAETPDKVGGPIDIVQIDAVGVRWMQRDPQSRCR